MIRSRLVRRALGIAIALIVGLIGACELLETDDAARPTPGPAQRSTDGSQGDARSSPSGTGSAELQDRYDLLADERRGGHTLERHVGKSEADLSERLRRQRDLRTASSFFDRETAESVVAATLGQNSRRLENWLARGDDRPNLALDYSGPPGHVVGISLSRNRNRATECSDARVVLRSDRSGDYYVLTAYPSCR